MKIIKIGNVELTEQEAQRIYDEGRYIVTYSKIYMLRKAAETFKGRVVYRTSEGGMTRRGRFYAMDNETVHNVFGLALPNY